MADNKKQSMMRFNLINLLGKLERDNTGFSAYSENPGLFDYLGKKGIKIVDSKGILADRPNVIGNTIFMTPGYGEYLVKMAEEDPASVRSMAEGIKTKPWSALAMEEVPHVQQFRERGLIGMVGKSLLDLAQVGFQQKKLYDVKESIEGFHYSDPIEKLRLQRVIYPSYKGFV